LQLELDFYHGADKAIIERGHFFFKNYKKKLENFVLDKKSIHFSYQRTSKNCLLWYIFTSGGFKHQK